MSRILFYKKSNLLGTTGGIEHVLSILCNELAKRGHQVFLATRDKTEAPLFYPLNKDVSFHHFKLHFSKLKKLVSQLTYNLIPYFDRELFIAKAIRAYCDKIKPDVIITAGIQDLTDIVYDNPYPCKKIVQLHSYPEVFFTKKKCRLFETTLQQADVVQVLFPRYCEVIQRHYHGQIAAIGNIVPQTDVLAQLTSKVIVYMARIDPDKRQHLLIESFARLANKYPNWQVHLWGAGTDKAYLAQCQTFIRKHHLTEAVLLKGVTQNPLQELQKASICAFPSKYEGFPLVLTEAMSLGLPCLGFKSCTGVNELIKNDINGLLATDETDFTSLLEKLMQTPELRQKLGEKAHLISKEYSVNKIVSQWEDLMI